MSVARTIRSVVKGIEQAEGVGATVRRSIGSRTSKMFNPFLLLDHFTQTQPGGFPEHPHKGQETITLVLNGAVAHEDFTGSKGVLYPGDLQFTTAGRGIVHSEIPILPKDGSPVEGIQLWVDLPEHLKETDPSYRDLREWEVPQVEAQDGKVSVKIISGKAYGVESIKKLASTPIDYYLYSLKSGGRFKQELKPEFNYFLYMAKGGELTVNNAQTLTAFENAFFNQDGDFVEGENTGESDVLFALVGGPKQNQRVLHYGPFIGTTNEYLERAIVDFENATAGFTNRRTWKSLISNGVTEEMINGPLNGSLEQREKAKQEYLEANKKV
jgi:redox-sensitive bicupin YhaK (pirin superfamily)